MLELAAAAGDLDLITLTNQVFASGAARATVIIMLGNKSDKSRLIAGANRLSILGIWQPLVTFLFSLTVGSFGYVLQLRIMDLSTRARLLGSIGRNGRSRDCIYFFLPSYCSEMNRIKLERLHIKRDELCGKCLIANLKLTIMSSVAFRKEAARMATQSSMWTFHLAA